MSKLNLPDGFIDQRKRDEFFFFVGVGNLMISSWLIGAFPWLYWIYHSFKMILLLSFRVYNFTEKKLQFWLFEYCYIVNYWLLLYYLLCLVQSCPWQETIFRVAFTCCVGPLALSIAAFRNSLVFHSSSQTIILAIHFSPNVAMWGMRWWPSQLENIFPNTFQIGCNSSPRAQFSLFFSSEDCPATFTQLYAWPLFHYFVLWAIPYYIFFFVIGKKILRKGGYYTMFDDMLKNPFVKKAINIGGSWGQEFKYMCCHGLLCSIAFFLGPLLWHSFVLHSIYLGLIVAIAVYNGGSYYFQVFAKTYYRKLIEEEIDAEVAAPDIETIDAGITLDNDITEG